MINWSTISLRDLAGFISEEFRKSGIDTVLVGGACVTIYSENRYQSHDLDYITYEDRRKVKKVLHELGFIEKYKYFQHPDCPWFIEFVSPPVAVGNEPIHQFAHVTTPLGTIKMLRPVDSVKDRLASFYHWKDRQGLEQAINICLEQEIDFEEIKNWSEKENHEKEYDDFTLLLERRKSRG